MPPVHLGAVQDALESSHPDVEVPVDVHPPDRAHGPLEHRDRGRRPEEDDRRELDRLVDQDLERMRPDPRQPVDLGDGVVRVWIRQSAGTRC